MSLINERDYAGASDLLAEEHASRPNDKRITFLYAESELGLANFEMFDFVRQISGAQEPSDTIDLSIPTPNCVNNAIDLKGADIRCVIFRIMQHLPDATSSHFQTARSLLRDNFPDASQSPVEVNFLIAFVDLSSALYTSRTVLLKSNAHFLKVDRAGRVSEDQFHFVIHSAKEFWADSIDSIRRLKYSYSKLKKLIYGEKGTAIIKIGNRELNIENMVDSSQIFLFFADVAHDQTGSINGEGNRWIRDRLGFFNSELGDFASTITREFSRGGPAASEALNVVWRFDQALELLLHHGTGEIGSALGTGPVDLIWKHPPKIFSGLFDSFKAAYDGESRQPVLDYYETTKTAWLDLNANLDHWDEWLQKDLSPSQREALRANLEEFVKNDPRFQAPPTELVGDALEKWETNLVAALQEKLEHVLSASEAVSALATMSPAQSQRGLALVSESLDWLRSNLHNSR
jgi:hypothetical protein